MSAQPPTDRPVGWARFRHGSFECTVVSDGIIRLGPARESFPGADPEEIDALLREHYLPTDEVRLNQNILFVNTGDHLIMFDSGVGNVADLGKKEFGPQTGKAIPNMVGAGIDPGDVDIVAITHAHPDHSWGLVDDDGNRLFPNARIAVSDADYSYWTDLSHVEGAPSEQVKDQFRGAHKNLTAYSDRLILLQDGAEIAPGITAIATPGHTPGHMMYKISSEAATIICWGDVCHHEVLLLQRPDWNFMFDHNGAAATAQRLRVYDLVHSKRYAVLGYHFPFPGLGHIRKDGIGYAWIPSDLERQLPATNS